MMNEFLQGEWYVSDTNITGNLAKSGKYHFNSNGTIEIFESLQNKLKFRKPTILKYKVLKHDILEITYSNNTKTKFDLVILDDNKLKISSCDNEADTVFCRII